jgi:hypothetical protein
MIHLLQKPLLGVPVNWSHPLARGLVGCWLMNEGGGNKIYNLSGNRNAGTFVGDTQWAPGKFGSCLSFDGTGDYVTTNKDIIGTESFTISAWIYLKSSAATMGIVESAETGAPGFVAGLITGNLFLRVARRAVEWLATGATILPLNTWVFVACTYNGTAGNTTVVYLNGRTDGNNYDTDIFTSGNLYIGIYRNSYFNGYIDDVMIFNRALTAQEVAQLYREPFCMFDRPSIGLLYVPPAGGQTILDYERGVRGVNRGVMVGVS